jgi:hypothetical protein
LVQNTPFHVQGAEGAPFRAKKGELLIVLWNVDECVIGTKGVCELCEFCSILNRKAHKNKHEKAVHK